MGIVALAGNPNVGKSTVFNNLTGLKQHTGNWPGKTVSNASGYCKVGDREIMLVDIPGTYSLMAHSAEEEVARDFICFGGADAVVVVCDATCLERNLNLALQITEITRKVAICVNLADEAERKGIYIDTDTLSKRLGVEVVKTVARERKSLDRLLAVMSTLTTDTTKPDCTAETGFVSVEYDGIIEEAIAILQPHVCVALNGMGKQSLNSRWVCLKLLEGDETLLGSLDAYLGSKLLADGAVYEGLERAKILLTENGIDENALKDKVVATIIRQAEAISAEAVTVTNAEYNQADLRIDKLITNRLTGIPIMLVLLTGVFWLTLAGANYPTKLLSGLLFGVQDKLTDLFIYLNAPEWLHGMLVLGVYRVLAWVVSVMLPPMAIFFPIFTLLEDLGYLPRVAFNLDKHFAKCRACGKQALTMCMGLGCNAAGVIGCRIIDSPRERLLAIITNNFVPCNGRFPTLIAILTMFFAGGVGAGAGGFIGTLVSATLLTLVILLGVIMTLVVSRLLSATALKGVPSSFTLELPPYRKPEIGKVIIRSVFDRTLFVLGRAAAVAAPAGLVIWIFANVNVGSMSLLAHCAGFLDPFGRMLGMDGTILFAFILGFPANEIVVPIIIMAYMSGGTLVELDSLSALRELLVENGWTPITAICMMLFSLMHWPCSTTCLTIKKETNSLKWTFVSIAVPTILGMAACFVVASVARMLG